MLMYAVMMNECSKSITIQNDNNMLLHRYWSLMSQMVMSSVGVRLIAPLQSLCLYLTQRHRMKMMVRLCWSELRVYIPADTRHFSDHKCMLVPLTSKLANHQNLYSATYDCRSDFVSRVAQGEEGCTIPAGARCQDHGWSWESGVSRHSNAQGLSRHIPAPLRATFNFLFV